MYQIIIQQKNVFFQKQKIVFCRNMPSNGVSCINKTQNDKSTTDIRVNEHLKRETLAISSLTLLEKLKKRILKNPLFYEGFLFWSLHTILSHYQINYLYPKLLKYKIIFFIFI